MLFKRRKGMVDMRELQKKGVVVIPNRNSRNSLTPTNQEGFIEIGKSKNLPQQTSSTQEGSNLSNKDFFGFQNLSNTSAESPTHFSTQSDGYNKREVDEKITELDNKIYKLENRLEVLEKKLGVDSGIQADTNVGVMGW